MLCRGSLPLNQVAMKPVFPVLLDSEPFGLKSTKAMDFIPPLCRRRFERRNARRLVGTTASTAPIERLDDESWVTSQNADRGRSLQLTSSLSRILAVSLGILFVQLALNSASVAEVASAAAHEHHQSVGERLATMSDMTGIFSLILENNNSGLKSRGIPTELVLMIISAMPVVELRGGIPVARLLGVDPLSAFTLCSLGNFVPVIPIILALNSPAIRRFLEKPLARAQRKFRGSTGMDNRSLAISLALFVGVPFPGTGAWTGTMASVALGLPAPLAMAANAVGILMAASIMTALTASLKAGLAVASAFGVVAAASALRRDCPSLGTTTAMRYIHFS
eukprot:jgi/Bigna1/90210/estExt_fgenesh1_pg.C_650047